MEPTGRYARQERLAQIGPEGQAALGRATAAVVGLGALGSTAADLLARAGVGRLLLFDRDVVELHNLQRQSLYDEEDARRGRPKADAARARLERVNSSIRIEARALDLCAENAEAELAGAELYLDGTDNFATRYLLNDLAVLRGRPYVYAGVVGTYGLSGAVLPGGPCLRCTWPEPPPPSETPTCRSAGVLGPAVAATAALAAGEALKILSGHMEAVFPGFRYLDLWTGEHRALRARRDPDCPCCARGEHPWLEGRRGARRAEPLCGGDAVQLPAAGPPPDLEALARRLEGTVGELERQPGWLRFREGGLELLLFADGRALVRGTEDPGRARALRDRTVGA